MPERSNERTDEYVRVRVYVNVCITLCLRRSHTLFLRSQTESFDFRLSFRWFVFAFYFRFILFLCLFLFILYLYIYFFLVVMLVVPKLLFFLLLFFFRCRYCTLYLYSHHLNHEHLVCHFVVMMLFAAACFHLLKGISSKFVHVSTST